ncbi:hypothetical protein Tco_0978830 [Tanacetum coccineum]|uniref:Uncharacterized protein n=1 Tax=Tanacetum coccineum TaxID=301880 RepID=A0ABQ5EPH6_9ASTR
MQNPEDISDPTIALVMALELILLNRFRIKIAQEEEAGIQSTQEEFEFMAAANDYEVTERVKVNCTLEDTLQQAFTLGTQSNNALVYDSDGSTKISYDKAYNDMQQKIEWLQAQLGDLKGKSSNTQYASNTLDPLSQKPKDENVSLEFQVPSLRESTVVNNERVIALGIFRINPFKASRVDKFMPNKHVKASVRTKPITISQPHFITKEDINSNRNGFSPNNIESTTRIRRPQPRNNPKNDKVPFKSKE